MLIWIKREPRRWQRINIEGKLTWYLSSLYLLTIQIGEWCYNRSWDVEIERAGLISHEIKGWGAQTITVLIEI